MSSAPTQIHYLTISAEKDLTNSNIGDGKTWSNALDLVEQHVGFRRLYWGRSPEDMSKVQLHIGKSHIRSLEIGRKMESHC